MEQFKGLEIVTEYEYRIFHKLAHDPDLHGTASHLKRYALSVNKKNDAFYKVTTLFHNVSNCMGDKLNIFSLRYIIPCVYSGISDGTI